MDNNPVSLPAFPNQTGQPVQQTPIEQTSVQQPIVKKKSGWLKWIGIIFGSIFLIVALLLAYMIYQLNFANTITK